MALGSTQAKAALTNRGSQLIRVIDNKPKNLSSLFMRSDFSDHVNVHNMIRGPPHDDVTILLRDQINLVAANGDLWGPRRVKEFLNNDGLSCMTKTMLDQIDQSGEVMGWFQTIRTLLKTVD